MMHFCSALCCYYTYYTIITVIFHYTISTQHCNLRKCTVKSEKMSESLQCLEIGHHDNSHFLVVIVVTVAAASAVVVPVQTKDILGIFRY